MGRMQGKVAIVTGASSGIGRATALKLAAEGAKVAILARREDKLKEIEREIEREGGVALPIVVDVGDLDAYVAAIRKVDEHFGRLDALVNNAMEDGFGLIVDIDLQTWRQAFLVNMDAVFISTKEAFRLMPRTGGGAVVNVSSTCAMKALEGLAAYSASKAALQHFSMIAAMEGPMYNVRVNAVVPGWIDTPASTSAFADDPAAIQQICNSLVMKRMGRPEEMANSILFLCSDEASYVNGAALNVDGGHLMRIHT
jgi:NAD(P)-dependent dehydrogenase (short-subunit alcohol dehydrogenase family)